MIVLLVDDYPDALEVWDLFLTSAGYRVITALDGQEGLDKARTLLPDIAVLDLQLPSVSGAEMATALRGDPRTAHIPLIAATGHARTGLSETRAAGFDALIIKPCDPDDLLREIQRLAPITAAGSSH